ncbi:MAG: sugar ABC transporter ATP-binding protein [Ancalomicrobiaceae bacterium]|nr:sugar ABC transporter ATP-binding protein [Ancalomicrobiaceae bacterium]
MTGAPLLRARGLGKTFGTLVALADASVEIRAGEVRSLVGANGAGKSTLIKILTGAIRPTTGEVEIGGEIVETGRPAEMLARGVACIYQHSNLAPAMSVLDNIFLGRQPTRGLGLLDRPRQRREAEALIARYEIDLDLDATVADLPTVKQKEVEIAKALSLDAKILLMDEPTAWLAHEEVANLFRTIRTLKRNGVGIVYISHILDEIFEVCDTVTVLRDGRVVADWNIADITRQQLLQKFIGERLAADAGAHARRSRSARGTGTVKLAVNHLGRKGLFEGIDFEVYAGEIFCITGLIGSKRTELVRSIFGADRFDSGTIVIDGTEVRPRNPADGIGRGVGFVPEDRHRDGLMLKMSVEQNLIMSALGDVTDWGLMRRSRIADMSRAAIADLNILPPEPHKEVAKLSGGNQQKVLIGKWLQIHPDILLLDEPTVGVDVGAKAEIYTILRKLKAEGRAILVVSSDMEEVMTIADRIMVMRSGRMVGIWDADAVTQQEIVAYVGGE